MSGSLAERYVRLGLQVGRHVEGIVDAYFGPAEWAAEVDAAPPVEPRTLVAEAGALLGEVEDGWLRDQLAGLRVYAGVLAGESASYPDEVEGCYGVRPTFTDESVFEAAHEELEELLPGDGPLAERYEAWRTSTRVPAEQVERTVAAAIEEARRWTRPLVDLPEGEGIFLELVSDEPWLAFNDYRGDLRSRIEVNVDLPLAAIELLHLAIHETYAGHHTERCVKEHVLVRGRGLDRGVDRARADAAVADRRGDRRGRAAPAPRGRGRAGARRRLPRTPVSTSTSSRRSRSSGRSSPAAGRRSTQCSSSTTRARPRSRLARTWNAGAF